MSAATLDLIVTPDPDQPQRGTLVLGSQRYPCVLGRTGVRGDKHEGDGATPIGRFPLKRVLYRADRETPPETVLPVTPIRADDGWCDAPDDPSYNRAVTLPYPASAERLARDDRLYDIVVVLGYNDDPVQPGRGSAIFLHVAPEDGEPTAGCIALASRDLHEVLKSVDSRSSLVVKI